jgi:hypothetical protein
MPKDMPMHVISLTSGEKEAIRRALIVAAHTLDQEAIGARRTAESITFNAAEQEESTRFWNKLADSFIEQRDSAQQLANRFFL